MKIEKEYNVQGLADKVKGCIKTVCEIKSKNAIYAYMKKIA